MSATSTNEAPLYEHERENHTFLGRMSLGEKDRLGVAEVDLYICLRGESYDFAFQFGNEKSQYAGIKGTGSHVQGILERDPIYREIYRRAKAQKLI